MKRALGFRNSRSRRLQVFWGGLAQEDLRFHQHLTRKLVSIPALIENLANAGIDQHLGADGTGQVRAVKGRPLDTDSMEGRLDDGVLLGVQAPAELVTLSRRNLL